MRKFIYLAIATVLSGLLSVSCNKNEETVGTPTVSIVATPDINSVRLDISSENATQLAYIQVTDPNSIPSAQAIMAAGISLTVPGGSVTVGGLEPSTEYYFAAVASNGTEYSEVAFTETTTQAENITFDLRVTGATSTALAYSITPSNETVPYFVTAVSADLASASDEDIYAAVLLRIDELRGETGLSEYLSAQMKSGTRTSQVANLEPSTKYLVVAMCLSQEDGSLQSSIARAEGTTSEDITLTFELTATDVTATSAHVTVTPSDASASFVFLCQPSTSYPGIDESEPDSLAAEYIRRQGHLLEQGMGTYTGSQDYIMSVNSDSKYYLFAFGYTAGIGITSPCELLVFKTEHGVVTDEFQAEIETVTITATRVSFKVTPAEKMESIWYYPVVLPKSNYLWASAQANLSEILDEQYAMGNSFNPGYTMTDAVEAICGRGELTWDVAGLEPETKYVIAAVAVSNEGEPSTSGVTGEFTTLTDAVSTARFAHKLLAIYDGSQALAEGLFEGSETLLNGKALAVYELTISDDAVRCYYNSGIVGDYSNPEEEYRSDDDLMALVEGSIYTTELTDHSTTHLFVPMNYEDVTYTDYTFLTWAFDADGLRGPFCRTHVQARTTEVDDIQNLVDLINSLDGSQAPRLTPLFE